jgi:hypothetical protein
MVSPQKLSKQPISIFLPEEKYCTHTQTSTSSLTPNEIKAMAVTWGRTQTFNTKGSPSDSDND